MNKALHEKKKSSSFKALIYALNTDLVGLFALRARCQSVTISWGRDKGQCVYHFCRT